MPGSLPTMPMSLLASYVLFSFFLFYQQLHVKKYEGASAAFGAFLTLFAFGGTVFGLGFLVYYGYRTTWSHALLLFVIALAVKVLWFPLEIRLRTRIRYLVLFLSFGGFVGLPVCGYLMWRSLP